MCSSNVGQKHKHHITQTLLGMRDIALTPSLTLGGQLTPDPATIHRHWFKLVLHRIWNYNYERVVAVRESVLSDLIFGHWIRLLVDVASSYVLQCVTVIKANAPDRGQNYGLEAGCIQRRRFSNKRVCRAEMYAGRVACCRLVISRWVCRRDRQTDGRTPNRYVTLSAIDAASVTIVKALPRVADCRSVRLNEMYLLDGNCSEEPGICHENASCSLVSPEVCASERPISYKCVCNQGYNGDGSDCQGKITVTVVAHKILILLTLFLTSFI